jgi:hypothetical protein
MGILKTIDATAVSSNLTNPGFAFVAALRGSTEQQQRPQTHQVAVVGPGSMESRVLVPPVFLHQHEQQVTGQSVGVPNVKNMPLDNMLRIVTVVQQIMTEFNGAVTEEEKTVVITKSVLNIMKRNGP